MEKRIMSSPCSISFAENLFGQERAVGKGVNALGDAGLLGQADHFAEFRIGKRLAEHGQPQEFEFGAFPLLKLADEFLIETHLHVTQRLQIVPRVLAAVNARRAAEIADVRGLDKERKRLGQRQQVAQPLAIVRDNREVAHGTKSSSPKTSDQCTGSGLP